MAEGGVTDELVGSPEGQRGTPFHFERGYWTLRTVRGGQEERSERTSFVREERTERDGERIRGYGSHEK